MRKRYAFFIPFMLLVSMLAGCGGKQRQEEIGLERNEASTFVDSSSEPLNEVEIKRMYTNPGDYVGREVELVGQVFGGPEYDESGVYFQMMSDLENYSQNTVVGCMDPELILENQQYVKILGVIVNVAEGENMEGQKLIAPMIRADELEILSYKEAVVPTIATATAVTDTLEQVGYAVTIQRVELAEEETRVYISVENNGKNEFSVHSFNTIILQDGVQYSYELNYSANYPTLPFGVKVGTRAEGIMTFPAIKETPFKVLVEGSTYDWTENLEAYVFEFNTIERSKA